MKASISTTSHYAPKKTLTNLDLEKIIETTDDWIKTRTGIERRHIIGENEATSDMATNIALDLLKKSKLKPEQIELIIVCTVTPDHFAPSTAALVQNKIGAKNAFCFDLMAACSGFLFSLSTASMYIESGAYKQVVVVGADKMSSIVDYEDRTTCIIFGDGAGAVLLEPNEEGLGIQDAILKSDGSGRDYLNMKGGGSVSPSTHETVDAKEHYIYQDGKTVFKFAVTNMADVSAEIMERNNLKGDDVAWLVPHQANKRIIDATARRMGVGSEKVMLNIEKYGNTTNGTIPLCLWEWEDKLKKGDNLVLAAFGGGFTWGSIYLKWAY